jgi:cytochrome c-type biogenesis protein
MLNDWVTAFALGSAAILTNACLLPLYPGLIAFMAGSADKAVSRRSAATLGVLVLAGVLSAMFVIGLALFVLQQSFGAALGLVLPVVYGAVIVFGVLLLLNRNPFAKMSTARSPVFRSRSLTAYLYGVLLGPMTLPCTGPILTSAFLLGADDASTLASGMAYFLFFGLGFGWPLVLLPVLALPLQRRAVGWLARHHTLLNRVSGVLLIAIGIFGISTELLPQYVPEIEISAAGWFAYWAAVAALIVGWLAWSLSRERAERAQPQPLSD